VACLNQVYSTKDELDDRQLVCLSWKAYMSVTLSPEFSTRDLHNSQSAFLTISGLAVTLTF